ncbi:hypothetical protein PAI11_27390 [Patulibacter medicamentivorans]|uniref:Uncharacterized protein n=1 Tax=Patulibacter medicamentivorans TaxID=1097667 RepID=H0E7D7_9ACTN|nr:hypothetical protein PAI11_27390 [Patulibacter medicamentivorans]
MLRQVPDRRLGSDAVVAAVAQHDRLPAQEQVALEAVELALRILVDRQLGLLQALDASVRDEPLLRVDDVGAGLAGLQPAVGAAGQQRLDLADRGAGPQVDAGAAGSDRDVGLRRQAGDLALDAGRAPDQRLRRRGLGGDLLDRLAERVVVDGPAARREPEADVARQVGDRGVDVEVGRVDQGVQRLAGSGAELEVGDDPVGGVEAGAAQVVDPAGERRDRGVGLDVDVRVVLGQQPRVAVGEAGLDRSEGAAGGGERAAPGAGLLDGHAGRQVAGPGHDLGLDRAVGAAGVGGGDVLDRRARAVGDLPPVGTGIVDRDLERFGQRADRDADVLAGGAVDQLCLGLERGRGAGTGAHDGAGLAEAEAHPRQRRGGRVLQAGAHRRGPLLGGAVVEAADGGDLGAGAGLGDADVDVGRALGGLRQLGRRGPALGRAGAAGVVADVDVVARDPAVERVVDQRLDLQRQRRRLAGQALDADLELLEADDADRRHHVRQRIAVDVELRRHRDERQLLADDLARGRLELGEELVVDDVVAAADRLERADRRAQHGLQRVDQALRQRAGEGLDLVERLLPAGQDADQVELRERRQGLGQPERRPWPRLRSRRHRERRGHHRGHRRRPRPAYHPTSPCIA